MTFATHPEAAELTALVQRHNMLRNQMVDVLQRYQREVRLHGIAPWSVIHEMNGARIAFGEIAIQYESLKLPSFG